MEDAATIARNKAMARQRRYYEKNAEVIRERKKQRYDPEKAAEYYAENREAIRSKQRELYLVHKKTNQRTRLSDLLPIASPHLQKVIEQLITAVDAGLMHDEEISGIEKAVLVESSISKGNNTASDSKSPE